ncbi:MAG: ABC transporter ATP-binding protein [Acidimicrobiia bacterium]
MSLVVQGLVKCFQPGAEPVLNGVSFVVQPGSVTCLLGPSGVGKTTVLHIIAGLADADAGTVNLNGSALEGTPVHRRPLTLLMQQPQLFGHLDVIDNVAFGQRVRGVARRARRSRSHELLELVGVDHLANRSTHHLSGGEQQRVALARALAVQPAVLLADEPFASVDASLRRDLQDLIASIHRELGTTMLMVTHDVDEARRIADCCIVLEHGRVLTQGHPRDVLGRPTTSTVQPPWSAHRHVKNAEPQNLKPAEMPSLVGGSQSFGASP